MRSVFLCRVELFRQFTRPGDKFTPVVIAKYQRQYSSNPVCKDQTNKEEKNDAENPQKPEKMVRIAVVGVPNAGKSSFINHLVKRQVCPTSQKVHTTRTSSKAIFTKNESQMILFDNPGLVSTAELKKFDLESSFQTSHRTSIQNSDLVAVVHDVSNSWTRNTLHPSVMDTLNEYRRLPSILILNKVDKLRSKRILLDLVRILTENTLVCNDRQYLPWKGSEAAFLKDMARHVKYKNKSSAGWPYFSDVFMVSSLTGDGFSGVLKYLEEASINRKWTHKPTDVTDEKPEKLILGHVQASLLDFLPQEVPYKLRTEMEYFEMRADKIIAHVNVICPTERLENLVRGPNNTKIKLINEIATTHLVRLYKLTVSLSINVISEKNIK